MFDAGRVTLIHSCPAAGAVPLEPGDGLASVLMTASRVAEVVVALDGAFVVLLGGVFVVLLDGAFVVLLDGAFVVLLDGAFVVLLGRVLEVLLDGAPVGEADPVLEGELVPEGVPDVVPDGEALPVLEGEPEPVPGEFVPVPGEPVPVPGEFVPVPGEPVPVVPVPAPAELVEEDGEDDGEPDVGGDEELGGGLLDGGVEDEEVWLSGWHWELVIGLAALRAVGSSTAACATPCVPTESSTPPLTRPTATVRTCTKHMKIVLFYVFFYVFYVFYVFVRACSRFGDDHESLVRYDLTHIPFQRQLCLARARGWSQIARGWSGLRAAQSGCGAPGSCRGAPGSCRRVPGSCRELRGSVKCVGPWVRGVRLGTFLRC